MSATPITTAMVVFHSLELKLSRSERRAQSLMVVPSTTGRRDGFEYPRHLSPRRDLFYAVESAYLRTARPPTRRIVAGGWKVLVQVCRKSLNRSATLSNTGRSLGVGPKQTISSK